VGATFRPEISPHFLHAFIKQVGAITHIRTRTSRRKKEVGPTVL
jgi:hypothetical protein